MSLISQLIVLAALAYALVVLVVVLTYWTSQVVEGSVIWREGFVERSVRLYRLLLAAYPDSFRNEYGEAMVQLFRDTTRDAYRRRGLLGLAAMWLRTLPDFTISVLRQHRDKPVQASSESALLRDFLQKWRRFGSEALSVTAFSTWYGWHLLRLYFRRTALVWATLTAIALVTWIASLFDSFTWMKGRATWVGLQKGGLVVISHVYEVGEPVADEQAVRDLRAWNERNRSLAERFASSPRPWEFSFFSDIPGGRVVQWRTIENGLGRDGHHHFRQEPILTQPSKSWLLRFPFGIFPALLLVWTIRVYLRRNAGAVVAMQSE